MFIPFILIIAILLTLFYVWLILLYRRWFVRLKPFVDAIETQPAVSFSIIIPARNEAANIGACLKSITAQNYPSHLIEIIVIDDYSTDNTAAIVQQWQQQYANIQLIDLSKESRDATTNSYKKWAIERAIHYARGEWIVTTDADCVAGKNWISSFAKCIEKEQPILIAAPVRFIYYPTLLGAFQYLDFLSLQGITAASVSAGWHSMCNGANLAYQKAAFFAVNGFTGINHIASGDDMLLMNKIKQRYPGKATYLFHPNAIVLTQPVFSWYELLHQRIRWASKADKYEDKSIFGVLLFVYLYNLVLFIMPLLAFFEWRMLIYWMILLLIKTLTELRFMKPVSRFFGENHLHWFPFLQPIHIAYTVIVGWLGKFGHYQWKGRRVV
ncbi:MAG: glycosyltransferase [Sphingobacteriales bacterium]|uniref:glycosyltransferase n=1 Tax=Hydrotalea flava TaxID=714549 RepID=UPI00082EBC78|nr:glycosyltransferase [Hydrotalea flava]RTL52638.1 MAG: glycosyltransferase [Sphingobacteriales bacterium]